MFITVSRTIVLFFVSASIGCGQVVPEPEQRADSAGIFLPMNARKVQRRQRHGIREVTYVVAAPYPASEFLCQLTNHLDLERWRGLREDLLNPGTPSSIVRGWGDYDDATRKPETRVHTWLSSWSNEAGDVVTYALRYEYPKTSPRDLNTLHVGAIFWPPDVVQEAVGDRAGQLRPLFATPVADGTTTTAPRTCDTPQWSDFVKRTVRYSAVPGLPSELGSIRSIRIQNDVDGFAGRISAALKERLPELQIGTLHDAASEISDAMLAFNFTCRCNEPGIPDGLYVHEAVVYKPARERDWLEPARILFYWSDGGEPAWKKVQKECFGQKNPSVACKTAFQDADIAFVTELASALDNGFRAR